MSIDTTALFIMLLKNQAMLETIYETQANIIARLEEREQEDVYGEMIEKQALVEQELLRLYRESIPSMMNPGTSFPQGEA